MRMTLSMSVKAVLLGGGGLTFRVAFSLFTKYMLSSHVFSCKAPFYRRLPFFSAFHSLPDPQNDALTLMALEHLQREYGESTYLLIPCDELSNAFVSRNKEYLERRFIVRYPDDVFSAKNVFPLS